MIFVFDKSADRFDIYLDEKKVQLKEDKTNPDIISYGFGEYRTIQDYPIRGRATYLLLAELFFHQDKYQNGQHSCRN